MPDRQDQLDQFRQRESAQERDYNQSRRISQELTSQIRSLRAQIENITIKTQKMNFGDPRQQELAVKALNLQDELTRLKAIRKIYKNSQLNFFNSLKASLHVGKQHLLVPNEYDEFKEDPDGGTMISHKDPNTETETKRDTIGLSMIGISLDPETAIKQMRHHKSAIDDLAEYKKSQQADERTVHARTTSPTANAYIATTMAINGLPCKVLQPGLRHRHVETARANAIMRVQGTTAAMSDIWQEIKDTPDEMLAQERKNEMLKELTEAYNFGIQPRDKGPDHKVALEESSSRYERSFEELLQKGMSPEVLKQIPSLKLDSKRAGHESKAEKALSIATNLKGHLSDKTGFNSSGVKEMERRLLQQGNKNKKTIPMLLEEFRQEAKRALTHTANVRTTDEHKLDSKGRVRSGSSSSDEGLKMAASAATAPPSSLRPL